MDPKAFARPGAFKARSCGVNMRTILGFLLVVFCCGLCLAQVTPRRQEVKPTEDETALRGVTTYWIDENPQMNRRILEDLAAKLEKDVKVTPAASRDEAGMVLVVDLFQEGKNVFGVVLERDYECLVFVKGQYVWRFTKGCTTMNGVDEVQVVSYALGWHVVKKWKKANK